MPDLFIAKNKETKITDPEKNSETKLPEEDSQTANHPGLTTTFCEFPQHLYFEGQKKDEVVHLFLRSHFVTNFRWITLSIIFILLPLLFFILLPYLSLSFTIFNFNHLLIFIFFYYSLLFGYVFINFLTWFYNIGMITNLRVVDIDVSYITNKNISSTGIMDIIDVDYSQNSFLGNLFQYADVYLQTQGIKPNFEFTAAPNPAKVAEIILDLKQKKNYE